MKRNFFFFYLIFISLVLLSCVTKRATEPVIITNTKETVRTVRDTIFKVEADSSSYRAFIDCVNGKPIIRETDFTKSKKGKILNIPKTVLKGNQLTVDCYKNEQELKKQWEETHTKATEQIPIYINVPVEVEKPLTFWQKTQIWFGRIFMGILSIFVIIGVLRWRRIL
ncbi:hypothetical protein [Epilithonimonas xixisoli]|uniref:Lipoprotein n=1 Tax=Epilithonimonas xixisoli TaxID=1476462 RepID=A0A4R8I841_9FLAO|nr:hypothetical protein [Epilithonimonas xixisoli]TDX86182.1 hypothetical protein B0I22_0292 [Epilithonimonas xixisoli]